MEWRRVELCNQALSLLRPSASRFIVRESPRDNKKGVQTLDGELPSVPQSTSASNFRGGERERETSILLYVICSLFMNFTSANPQSNCGQMLAIMS